MEKIELGHIEQVDLRIIAVIILSFFDVTIKLSSLPILLIALYWAWKDRAGLYFKLILTLTFLSSIVFLPWIIRNVVETGYLIFPFAQLDVFRFDWKVPPELVKEAAIAITGWARVPGQDANLAISMPFGQWFAIWYRMLYRKELILFAGILLGLVLTMILIIVNKQIRSQVHAYRVVYVISAIGAIFWFVQAPAPRFGYGFLVALLLLFYAPLICLLFRLRERISKWFIPIIQFVLVVFVLSMIAIGQIPPKVWRGHLYSVKPYPQIETTSFRLANQTLFVPVSGDQCWYEAFPCAPSIASNLKMRGSNSARRFLHFGKIRCQILPFVMRSR